MWVIAVAQKLQSQRAVLSLYDYDSSCQHGAAVPDHHSRAALDD
jgi:hypothetical protein